jgi:hypothetical protein
MSHTPGPWRVGRNGAVVADVPIPEMQGSDEVEYYGGHLVAESITPSNAQLIAAAPDLLQACRDTMDYWESTGFAECEEGCDCIVDQMRAALAKARGQPPIEPHEIDRFADEGNPHHP